MKTNKNLIVRPRTPEIVERNDEFALLTSADQMTRALQLIESNLAAQTFDPRDMPKIKGPAGGNPDLRLEGATGSRPVEELEGVVVAFRQTRAYWAKAYGTGGGNKPPDCSSHDGFLGVGKIWPEGKNECYKCPHSQFGSGPNGDGQACQDRRELLVLLPGQQLPHFFSVPPASIKNWGAYTLKLLYERPPVEFWEVVTRISTVPSKSGGGVEYSRLHFSMARRLTPEEAGRCEPYHRKMRELLTPMVVDTHAYEIEAPEEKGAETEETIPF